MISDLYMTYQTYHCQRSFDANNLAKQNPLHHIIGMVQIKYVHHLPTLNQMAHWMIVLPQTFGGFINQGQGGHDFDFLDLRSSQV